MGEAGTLRPDLRGGPWRDLGHAESPVTPLIESLADVQGNYMTSRGLGSLVRVVAGAGTGAVVYVGAPDQMTPFTVSLGTTTTVPIWITGVTDLGSASFTLAFDPAVVQPLACHPYAPPATTRVRPLRGACGPHPRQPALTHGLTGPLLALEAVFAPAGAVSPAPAVT